MSTSFDSSLFVDIAEAIGLGNPAIVEKDYYVVQLLKLVDTITLPFHDIVFTGGTALAKSHINTFRMSEDVDLKIAPNSGFATLSSRSAKRKARKHVKDVIAQLLHVSSIFLIDEEAVILDEYRYICFNIRFPQQYSQAPCLRPFIKLELVESSLFCDAESKEIGSIYAEVLKLPKEIASFECSTIIETQAEKIVSMLRRTASADRNSEREDDATLIRHIYDTYHIQTTSPSNVGALALLVNRVINTDVARFGNQHPQFVAAPIIELQYGLHLLSSVSSHQERYTQYLSPMVYAKTPVQWEEAFAVFESLVSNVFELLPS